MKRLFLLFFCCLFIYGHGGAQQVKRTIDNSFLNGLFELVKIKGAGEPDSDPAMCREVGSFKIDSVTVGALRVLKVMLHNNDKCLYVRADYLDVYPRLKGCFSTYGLESGFVVCGLIKRMYPAATCSYNVYGKNRNGRRVISVKVKRKCVKYIHKLLKQHTLGGVVAF